MPSNEECYLCGSNACTQLGIFYHLDTFPLCRWCSRTMYHCGCGLYAFNYDTTLIENQRLCPLCVAEYRQCEVCNAHVLESDLTYLGSHGVCQICALDYEVCRCCEGLIPTVDAFPYGYEFLCESCFDRNYFICVECRDVFHQDYETIRRDMSYCPDCIEDIDRVNLRPYHAGLPLTFHGDDSSVYYGIELEVDKFTLLEEAIQFFAPTSVPYWIEEDRSVSDGFEMVFHPRTLSSWQEFEQPLQSITTKLRSFGGKSFNTTTCGIHVHRSKEDLSTLDLCKLIAAMVRLQGKIVRIAQRRSERYASFNKWDIHPDNASITYTKYKEGDLEKDRYVALNLKNSNTIEFRVFKGTLNVDTILAYIEFCDAFVCWCKEASVMSIFTWTVSDMWESFVDFVTKSKTYDKLYRYLKKKDIL